MRPYLHSHSSPHDRAPPSPSLPTFRDRRFSMPSSYEKPTSHVAQRSTLSVYKQDVQEERKPETKSPASKSFPSITNLTRKLSSHSRGRESPMEPSNETKNTLPPIGSPNQSDRGVTSSTPGIRRRPFLLSRMFSKGVRNYGSWRSRKPVSATIADSCRDGIGTGHVTMEGLGTPPCQS